MSNKCQKRVTVIGGANVDIVARYISNRDVFADSFSGDISTTAGGVARNIAENLTHLGLPVRLITAIGDDDFSAIIRASLGLANLEIHTCHIASPSRSDTYLSLFGHDGEMLHAVNQMALIDQLTPDYLDHLADEIRASDLIIADCNIPPESLSWLARLKGRPALYIDGVSSEKITRLKHCPGQFDGLKCNLKEASALTDMPEATDPAVLMDSLLDLGISTIILSLGSDGILFHHAGERIHMPKPAAVDDIISVSGAGDALFAGYIYGALSHRCDREALDLGLRAARLSLQCAGAVNPDISALTRTGPA